MLKFSVYQNDKTFGANSIISLSFSQPYEYLMSYKNQKLQFLYATTQLYCHEPLCISIINYEYLHYSLAHFYLIKAFYCRASPVNVIDYLRNQNYICDGVLLVLSWNNVLPTVHEGVFSSERLVVGVATTSLLRRKIGLYD